MRRSTWWETTTAIREYAARSAGCLPDPALAGRVVVHGSLPPEELARLYRSADVFVHPSLHEAYGTACAEAMAAGLPVIASRTDNLPYLVRDGMMACWSIRPTQTPCAAALNQLALDPGLRRRLASSCPGTRTCSTYMGTSPPIFSSAR